MTSQHRDYLLVAAIDFGTTFSGYAFSFRHEFLENPLKINANTSWKSSAQGLVSWKAPTTVLLRPDESFDSFGYDAEEKYAQLAEDEKHRDWFYFKKFKMLLHKHQELRRDTKIPDENGHELAARTVFMHAIRFMKESFESCIQGRGLEVETDEILWVLTVPAIWNEPAKQFMREAAEEAGIQHSNLKFALEPEAASMYCMHSKLEKAVGSRGSHLVPFPPGCKYMILDCGGGTVDVTVHEVLPDNKLKELIKASGGAWGGTRVDEHFICLYNKIFGKQVMDRYKKEAQYDLLELDRSFETKKRNINEESKLVVPVYTSLREFADEEYGRNPEDILADTEYAGSIRIRRDRMSIDPGIHRQMFDESINSIIDHVREVLQKPKAAGVEKILFVGGFSEAPVVRNAVADAFPNLQPVVPDDPGLAVLKGAVIYGHSPLAISSRVMKYTYGIAAQGPFVEGMHPSEKKVVIGGEAFCKDLFSKIVRIDSDVGDTELISKDYTINNQYAPLEITIYASTEEYPILVTDNGCSKLGEIIINQPIGGWRQTSKVKVSFCFGGTEFKIKAVEEKTQLEQEAVFNCLN